MLGEGISLFIGEHAASREEPKAFRRLEGEAVATPRNDIDDELGVLPIVELVGIHIDVAAADLPELNVVAADAEFAGRIAHRRRTVAAPAGLMEHQWPMLGPQFLNKGQSLRGCGYSRRGHFAFHWLNFGLYVSSPGQRANQPFRPIWGAGLYNDIERLRREGRHGQGYLRPRGDLGSAIKNRETLYTHIRPLEGDEQRHGETGGDDCLGAGPTLSRRSRAEAEAQDPGRQQLICEKVCCALPTANANTAAPPATTRTQPQPRPHRLVNNRTSGRVPQIGNVI